MDWAIMQADVERIHRLAAMLHAKCLASVRCQYQHDRNSCPLTRNGSHCAADAASSCVLTWQNKHHMAGLIGSSVVVVRTLSDGRSSTYRKSAHAGFTAKAFSFIIHSWLCKHGAPCLMHFAPNLQNRILACPVRGNGNVTCSQGLSHYFCYL